MGCAGSDDARLRASFSGPTDKCGAARPDVVTRLNVRQRRQSRRDGKLPQSLDRDACSAPCGPRVLATASMASGNRARRDAAHSRLVATVWPSRWALRVLEGTHGQLLRGGVRPRSPGFARIPPCDSVGCGSPDLDVLAARTSSADIADLSAVQPLHRAGGRLMCRRGQFWTGSL